MNQLAIDFAPHMAVRTTDPETSHQAAAQAKELAARHHRTVLATLEAAHWPLGVDGIAARCNITGHACGKSMSELERAGRVMFTGRSVPSTSGRAQREWRAV